MNCTEGVVERAENGLVWVRTEGAGRACTACSRQGGCGRGTGGLLTGGLLDGGQTRLLCLPNTADVRPGDFVSVCAEDGLILRAAALLYLLPLALGFSGAMIALALTDSELWAFFGLGAGLVAGFAWAHRCRLENSPTAPIFRITRKSF